MLQFCMAMVNSALNSNPKCYTGILIQKKVFGVPIGPSGATEILGLIYADDPTFGYWYAHIMEHPDKPKVFVSAIVWSTKLVNAPSTQLQFERFRYWIMDRLEYEPCLSQRDGDVYSESKSLIGAATELAMMIIEFDIKKRCECDGKLADGSQADNRILSVYGMTGAFDENGAWPPPPMPTFLKVVRNQP